MGDGDYQKNWRPQTRSVRGGLNRSSFEETLEAIYATSGFVYQTAEEAEAAFKNEIERSIYSVRQSNCRNLPGSSCSYRGSGVCRATAVDILKVTSLACQVTQVIGLWACVPCLAPCQYILTEILPGFGVETIIVDWTDLVQWEKALSLPFVKP